MPVGPGRYGANAAAFLEKYGGQLCILIVVGGPGGGSFDVAVEDPRLLATIPRILRAMADDVEKDAARDIAAHDKHSRS